MKNLAKSSENEFQRKNPSTFFNPDELVDLIKAAEDVKPVVQSNGRARRLVDAGRIIGFDSTTGSQTSLYTVITDESNNLVTAYPGGDQEGSIQHVDVLRLDESGRILEHAEINFARVLNILYKIDDYQNQYPWIATIDPYGNTVVSSMQAQLVIDDLNKLQRDQQDPSLKEVIGKLIIVLESIDVHEYIKFMGD